MILSIIRNWIKFVFLCCLFPIGILVKFFDSALSSEHGDHAFTFFAQAFCLIPGVLGNYVRGAFYYLTLEKCGWNVNVSFGAFVAQKGVEIAENVYIGAYSIIGLCQIEAGAMLGSNVQIISGKQQHKHLEDGSLSSTNVKELEKISIGQYTWIGNSAIIMCNVGNGTIIGAGSVVTKDIPGKVIAVGNPAKVIKQL